MRSGSRNGDSVQSPQDARVSAPGRDVGAGLYLHVPFCRHRCGYCDFPLVAGAPSELIDRYVAALRTDLTRTAEAGPPVPTGSQAADPAWPGFDSVFVGGGTPTMLGASDLAGIVRLAKTVLPVTADAEVTVEANPENVTLPYLRELVAAGVTRLSLGVQSFSPHVLDFLDREHDPDAPTEAVAAAREAGFASVSLDLIYGAPAESGADWERTLDRTLGAAPDHVSCYALTLEPNTPYADRVRRGVQAAPDPDTQAARMESADSTLASAGYARYEVSNWARPGHASRHNANYWRVGDYLGVGAGAHGHWQGRRWWSLRSPARYASAVEQGVPTVAGAETVDAEQVRTERLLLGLRTAEGVSRPEIEPLDERVVERLVGAGLLRDGQGRLWLTPAGLALADAVTLELTG